MKQEEAHATLNARVFQRHPEVTNAARPDNVVRLVKRCLPHHTNPLCRRRQGIPQSFSLMPRNADAREHYVAIYERRPLPPEEASVWNRAIASYDINWTIGVVYPNGDPHATWVWGTVTKMHYLHAARNYQHGKLTRVP
eukprot:3813844-Pyramimonas_sp.AAC.1